MILDEIKLEFDKRYYLWCMKEAKKEYELDFRRLAQVKNIFTREFLEIKNKIPQENRSQILPSLIKASNSPILGDLGETLSQNEQDLVDRYYDLTRNNDLKKILREEEKLLKQYKINDLKKSYYQFFRK